MKKTIALILIVGLSITSVSNFSFAADTTTQANNCSTSGICGTAPKDFTAMLDFVTEMLNSIKTVGTQGSYMGKYVNPNRFQGNVFNPPKQTVVDTITRNVIQKTEFSLATTAIFAFSPSIVGDMIGGVALLSKNQIFLRDAKLVEQLESQVSEKNYELGLGGGRYEQVNSQNLAIMQGIISDYVAKGLLTGGSNINDGASYNNVTALLIQVLAAAKYFLYMGFTSQFDDISRAGSDQPISIRFNDAAIQNIVSDYNCARGPNYICSADHKTIGQVLSKALNSLSGSFAQAIATVKDANVRLGQLFVKNPSEDFKAREAELLVSMYGTQKLKGTLIDVKYNDNGSLKSAGKAVGTIGSAVGDMGSTVAEDAVLRARYLDYLDQPVGEAKQFQESIDDSVPPSTAINPDDITKLLDIYVQDVFAGQAKDLDLVSMAEVKDITPAFNILGQQIFTIKDKILGGKEKQNSLLSSLGAACELQCGRGGLCR